MDKNAIIKALRDYAQATSNEVANTVAAPIDLINTGLGRVGLGSEEPVGGSAWMRRQGLTAPVPEGIAQTLGETTGLVLPMAGAMKAKEIAAALRGMGENIAKPRGGGMAGGERGAIVWHGSPHKFDKFDASKIGTGEGAQAYGRGLYVAESPDVARMYRDTLSKSDKQFYVKGNRVEPEMLDAFESNVLNAKGYGRNKQDYLEELEMNRVSPSAIQRMSKVWDEMGDVTVKDVLPENASLYKIDLPDEHIAKMLDWDKPLSQQAPEVQAVIRSIAPTAKPYDIPIAHNPTGAEFYGMLSAPTEIGSSGASKMFREMGIPGIRYLDGGSRGAGAGTSNFVVFPGNENILNILERNGAPIPPQNLVKALRNGN